MVLSAISYNKKKENPSSLFIHDLLPTKTARRQTTLIIRFRIQVIFTSEHRANIVRTLAARGTGRRGSAIWEPPERTALTSCFLTCVPVTHGSESAIWRARVYTPCCFAVCVTHTGERINRVQPRTSHKHRESHGAQRILHCLLSFSCQTQNERKPFLFRRSSSPRLKARIKARARAQSADETLWSLTDSAKWRPFLADGNLKDFFALRRFTRSLHQIQITPI